MFKTFIDQNCILLIPKLPWMTSKLLEKYSSLKREHLALQNLNFFTFVGRFDPPIFGSVFPMRIRNQPTKMNVDPCGSGSTTLLVGFFVKRVDIELIPLSLVSKLILFNS